jgi:hypothetical protein
VPEIRPLVEKQGKINYDGYQNSQTLLKMAEPAAPYEPAKLADLVILDKDIQTCPEDQIKTIRPVATMLGGVFVFEAKK